MSPSVARTPLLWGGFANALDNGANWQVLQPRLAAGATTAFSYPLNSTAGLGALLLAAADFSQTASLTDAQLRDEGYRTLVRQIMDAVPSFPSLGAQPAAAIATRGRSTGEVSLLPESSWLVNKVSERQNQFRYAYPPFSLVFDMPFVVNTSAQPFEIAAAEEFLRFLESSAVQQSAGAYGLRPAKLGLSAADRTLFNAAQSAGVIVTDDLPGTPIAVPSRSSVLALLDWIRTVRST